MANNLPVPGQNARIMPSTPFKAVTLVANSCKRPPLQNRTPQTVRKVSQDAGTVEQVARSGLVKGHLLEKHSFVQLSATTHCATPSEKWCERRPLTPIVIVRQKRCVASTISKVHPRAQTERPVTAVPLIADVANLNPIAERVGRPSVEPRLSMRATPGAPNAVDQPRRVRRRRIRAPGHMLVRPRKHQFLRIDWFRGNNV
jgi:hypothetical protein